MSGSAKSQKDSAFSFLPMDPSGKLIIKAKLGDDIRKIPIFNEDITYDELLLMLQRVFRGKLNNTDEVTLKYQDEDGDLITINDSSDLNLAKQLHRLLKITVLIHGKEPLPTLDASEVQQVRAELVAIRDKVNTILDALAGTPQGLPQSQARPRERSVPRTERASSIQTEAAQPGRSVGDTKPNPGLTDSTSIFDPLKSSGGTGQQPQSSNGETDALATNATSTAPSAAHLFSQSDQSDQFSSHGQQPPPTQQQQQQQPLTQPAQSTPSPYGQTQSTQQYSTQAPSPQQPYGPQQTNQQYPSSYATQPQPTPSPTPGAPMPLPAAAGSSYPAGPTTGYPSSGQSQPQPTYPPGGSAPYSTQTPPTSYPQQPYGNTAYGQTGQAGYSGFPKQGHGYTQQAYQAYRNQPY